MASPKRVLPMSGWTKKSAADSVWHDSLTHWAVDPSAEPMPLSLSAWLDCVGVVAKRGELLEKQLQNRVGVRRRCLGICFSPLGWPEKKRKKKTTNGLVPFSDKMEPPPAGAGAGGLVVGTRIAVRWAHGWEDGAVSAVRIDSKSKLHTYTITYDDGETHDEDLRKEADWRYLDPPPLTVSQGGQQDARGTKKRLAKGARDGTERRTRHRQLPAAAAAEGAAEERGAGVQESSSTADDAVAAVAAADDDDAVAAAAAGTAAAGTAAADTAADTAAADDDDTAAAAADTSDDEPEQTWVSCDDCEKWRRVADSQFLRSARRWRCGDNRDHRFSSCVTPQAIVREYSP